MKIGHIRGGIHVAFTLPKDLGLSEYRPAFDRGWKPGEVTQVLESLCCNDQLGTTDPLEHVARWLKQRVKECRATAVEPTGQRLSRGDAWSLQCYWGSLEEFAGGMAEVNAVFAKALPRDLFDVGHLQVVHSQLGDYYIRATNKARDNSFLVIDELPTEEDASRVLIALAQWINGDLELDGGLKDAEKRVTYVSQPNTEEGR